MISLPLTQMLFHLAHTVRLSEMLVVGPDPTSIQSGEGLQEMSWWSEKTHRGSLCRVHKVGSVCAYVCACGGTCEMSILTPHTLLFFFFFVFVLHMKMHKTLHTGPVPGQMTPTTVTVTGNIFKHQLCSMFNLSENKYKHFHIVYIKNASYHNCIFIFEVLWLFWIMPL